MVTNSMICFAPFVEPDHQCGRPGGNDTSYRRNMISASHNNRDNPDKITLRAPMDG